MRIYNDLTRQKENLQPMEEGHYKVYVCGPTVYDFFHLGNARPFIVYDTLRRYLEYRGNRVDYVQNFTDIDDKMIRRAQAEGCSVQDLGDRMIAEYYKDAEGLNIKRPTHAPRATECIPEMIDMVNRLVEKGHAYVLEDGVYFDVQSWPEYGHLSRKPLDEMEEGAGGRTEVHDGKRSPMDFVLWKLKKPGEPFWPSPWGDGRPGWHIECSAMNLKYLGPTIDIHGGGQDLLFPHHENEIAQSEAANGVRFANYWMHNGFITVDRQKMSKSEGNFFMVRDLVEKFPYQVLRFFMLQVHYRMPINFSADLLASAQNGLERIQNCLDSLRFKAGKTEGHWGDEADLALKTCREDFESAMEDDLNTADAYAAIFEYVRKLNSQLAEGRISEDEMRRAAALIEELCDVLGLDLRAKDEDQIPESILSQVEARAAAKKAKNFAEADRIRNELTALGWKVEDTAEGPKLSRI